MRTRRWFSHVHLALADACCALVGSDTPEWDKARLAMGQGDMEKGREILDQKMLSRSPVQRWAAPEEIAQAVDFLCAEQSGLITGATIPVDGGLHLV